MLVNEEFTQTTNPLAYVDIVSEAIHRHKSLLGIEVSVKIVRENLNAALLFLYNYIYNNPLYLYKLQGKIIYIENTDEYFIDLVNFETPVTQKATHKIKDVKSVTFNIKQELQQNNIREHKYIGIKISNDLSETFRDLYIYRDSIGWYYYNNRVYINIGGSISTPLKQAKYKELIQLKYELKHDARFNGPIFVTTNCLANIWAIRNIEIDDTTEILPIPQIGNQAPRTQTKYYNKIDIPAEYNDILVDILLLYLLRKTNLQYYQSQFQIVMNGINNIIAKEGMAVNQPVVSNKQGE